MRYQAVTQSGSATTLEHSPFPIVVIIRRGEVVGAAAVALDGDRLGWATDRVERAPGTMVQRRGGDSHIARATAS